MSNLGNLFSMGFGGGGNDSGDALKYSAPKEPKRKSSFVKKKAEPEPNPAAGSASAAATVAPAPAKAPGPSKVMASAAVRLYKINQNTRAYEPVDNGSMLGCAVLGTGLTYQILVYNAVKAPQAAIPLSATFDYTVRDLYVSCADNAGNFWSLLFDSTDSMMNVLRVLGSILCHLNTHTESSTESLRRLLPRNPDVPAEDSTALAPGMSAGVYLSAYEIGDQSDYPGDQVLMPLKSIAAPDDLMKIKVGTNDVVSGLSDALIGLSKGDRFILGVSPRLFYQPLIYEWIAMTDRKFPTNWLVVQVEVVKIKSDTGAKEKKKKNKHKEDVPVAPVVEVAAPPPDATPDSLKARMARVAAAGGAGKSQLANIINPRAAVATPAVETPQKVAVAVAEPATASKTPDVVVTETALVPVTPQPAQATALSHTQSQQQVPQQQQQQQQQHFQQQPQYQAQDSLMLQKEAMLNNAVQQNPQQEYYMAQPAYAVAVAAPESISDASNSGMNNGMMMQGSGNRGMLNSPMSSSASSSMLSSVNTTAITMLLETQQSQQNQHFTQFQQSMMILQQSMMQMHTKLDQVGMQVTSTYTTVQQQQQQQQQQQLQLQNNAGMGMGMNMGMNMMTPMGYQHNSNVNNGMMGGFPGMYGGPAGYNNSMMMQGMNNAFNNGSNGNNSSFFGANGSGGGFPQHMMPGGGSAMRGKVDELISTAQYLVQQYESLKAENSELQSQQQQQQGASGQVTQLQQQVAQLQQQLAQKDSAIDIQKTSALKLEEEVKQHQKEKETLQASLLAMIAEKEKLQASLNAALEAASAAQATSANVDLNHPTIVAHITSEVTARTAVLTTKNQELEQIQQTLTQSHGQETAELRNRITALEGELSLEKEAVVAAQAALATAAAASASTGLDTVAESSRSAEDVERMEQQASLIQEQTEKIATLSSSLVSLEEERSQLQKQVQSQSEELLQKSAEVESALAAAKEATDSAATGTGNSGGIPEDDFKQCMQDVFLQAGATFLTQEELESVADEAQRATMEKVTKLHLKRLREVLRQITVSKLG